MNSTNTTPDWFDTVTTAYTFVLLVLRLVLPSALMIFCYCQVINHIWFNTGPNRTTKTALLQLVTTQIEKTSYPHYYIIHSYLDSYLRHPNLDTAYRKWKFVKVKVVFYVTYSAHRRTDTLGLGEGNDLIAEKVTQCPKV